MLDDLDAVAAAPEHHIVLFEDDRVRVLDTVIRPGEETAVHTHVWSGVLYVISWSPCVRCDEHGTVMMDSVRDGVSPQAMVMGPMVPGTSTMLRTGTITMASSGIGTRGAALGSSSTMESVR